MSRRRRSSEEDNNTIKKNKLEKVAELFDIPANVLSKSYQIEMLENKEVIIDGIQGVLEYTDDCIRISVGKQIICFKGRALSLKGLSDNSIIITGYILSMEFI